MAEAKKEKPAKGTLGLKRRFYIVEGDRIRREKPFCPKCGRALAGSTAQG